MELLMRAWSYFATNILEQPAFMIGLIVALGYILLKKPWYDVLAGVIKAIVGYLILTVGSSGLVSNFRPVLVGLKDRFNMDAMVIDPYFGQNAVTAGVEEVFGKELFDHIQGQKDGVPKKPDPTAALTIASSFGVLPEEAAYIGDSEVDLATGHAARMQTILVSWGFRGREALLEDGAECIVDSAEEIRKIVKKQEEK